MGGLVAMALGSSLGCAELDPNTDTCATVPGCLPPPPPPPEGFECVNEDPPPKEPPPDLVALQLFIVDLANPTLVPEGLTFRACFLAAVDCERPFADPNTGLGIATDPFPQIRQALMEQDPSGTLLRAARQILLPFDSNAFYGYIRMDAPNYVTSDYVLLNEAQLNLEPVFEVPIAEGGPTVRVAPVFVDPIAMPTVGTLEGFYQLAQAERDITKATISARTFDCDGNRAAGVSLNAAANGSGWAFQDGVPTAGEDLVTDQQGVIGFANLDPVGLELTAMMPGQDMPYRQATIPAQDNVLITLEMRPTSARARKFNVTLREN